MTELFYVYYLYDIKRKRSLKNPLYLCAASGKLGQRKG
jgi:hypothetical protein